MLAGLFSEGGANERMQPEVMQREFGPEGVSGLGLAVLQSPPAGRGLGEAVDGFGNNGFRAEGAYSDGQGCAQVGMVSLWPLRACLRGGLQIAVLPEVPTPSGANLDAIPTATPTPTAVPATSSATTNPRPVEANTGKQPVVSASGASVPDVRPTPRTIRASWYGIEDGYGIDSDKRRTASGELFDPYGRTAATLMYPIGTVLQVCYEGRCIEVRVNDRCRCEGLDLSRGAFMALAPLSQGVLYAEVAIAAD